MKREYEKLYSKIMNVLSRKIVESKGDEISLYDLVEYLKLYFGTYNAVLINHIDTLKMQINKNNGYSNLTPKKIDKQIPRVTNIISYTTKDNNCYVKLIFKDKKSNTYSILLSNIKDKVYAVNSSFSPEITQKIMNENDLKLSVLLMTLTSFNNLHPYVEYVFDGESKNKYNQSISDGFISCYLNLNNPEKSGIYFKDSYEANLASSFSKTYGHLDDYITYYKDEIMKKTTVNINDLNPFLKSIVDKMINQKQLNLK